MNRQGPASVLIADLDDKRVRVVSAYTLTAVTGLVVAARSVSEMFRAIDHSTYDALILGLYAEDLPVHSSVRLLREVHLMRPKLKIILLHAGMSLFWRRAAPLCGASALINRLEGLGQIHDVLRAIRRGRRSMRSDMSDRAVPAQSLRALSARERAVVGRMASGQSLTEIDIGECRSVKTVASYINTQRFASWA